MVDLTAGLMVDRKDNERAELMVLMMVGLMAGW